jgi:NAD(P)-dependent dehydrogenase (short-subunit alcohol dehydrogenase family)
MTILMFGPVLSLVGAPGLVPLSTVLEGQRALVKSAARQWGRKGIRVNWVAIGSEGNYPALASAAIPQVIELGPPPPPLGRVPNLASDAAALIGLLGSDAASVITGATLNIDGGNWMVP